MVGPVPGPSGSVGVLLLQAVDASSCHLPKKLRSEWVHVTRDTLFPVKQAIRRNVEEEWCGGTSSEQIPSGRQCKVFILLSSGFPPTFFGLQWRWSLVVAWNRENTTMSSFPVCGSINSYGYAGEELCLSLSAVNKVIIRLHVGCVKYPSL